MHYLGLWQAEIEVFLLSVCLETAVEFDFVLLAVVEHVFEGVTDDQVCIVEMVLYPIAIADLRYFIAACSQIGMP